MRHEVPLLEAGAGSVPRRRGAAARGPCAGAPRLPAPPGDPDAPPSHAAPARPRAAPPAPHPGPRRRPAAPFGIVGSTLITGAEPFAYTVSRVDVSRFGMWINTAHGDYDPDTGLVSAQFAANDADVLDAVLRYEDAWARDLPDGDWRFHDAPPDTFVAPEELRVGLVNHAQIVQGLVLAGQEGTVSRDAANRMFVRTDIAALNRLTRGDNSGWQRVISTWIAYGRDPRSSVVLARVQLGSAGELEQMTVVASSHHGIAITTLTVARGARASPWGRRRVL